MDGDFVHFFIKCVPTDAPKKIIRVVKSIMARKIFHPHPGVKQVLWGSKFRTSGYCMDTV